LSLPFDKLRIDGSMVLSGLYPFSFLRSQSAKTKMEKIIKYLSAEGYESVSDTTA
jgi:hypothetical protein